MSEAHVFRSSMRRGIGSRYSNRHEPTYLSGKFWCIIIASRCILKGILIGCASHAFFSLPDDMPALNFQPLRGVYPYSVRRVQTGIPPSNAEKKTYGHVVCSCRLAVVQCQCVGFHVLGFFHLPSNRPGLGLHVRVTTTLICRP